MRAIVNTEYPAQGAAPRPYPGQRRGWRRLWLMAQLGHAFWDWAESGQEGGCMAVDSAAPGFGARGATGTLVTRASACVLGGGRGVVAGNVPPTRLRAAAAAWCCNPTRPRAKGGCHGAGYVCRAASQRRSVWCTWTLQPERRQGWVQTPGPAKGAHQAVGADEHMLHS